jgi:HAD superfamily hydrolase (TIGR01509 family)
MPSRSRGLFLDLDGTLADSLSVLRLVYFRFLENFRHVGSDREFEGLNGPTLPEIVAKLQRLYRLPGTAADLVLAYTELVDAEYLKVLPVAGARNLLEAAAERGWTLTLVTSNVRKRTQAWLSGVGFSSLLHFVVSGEEVERGKPWPDLYQLALCRSGCQAIESIAVEDSLQGAKAAVAAGLRTFVVNPQRASLTEWPVGAEPIQELKDLISWL